MYTVVSGRRCRGGTAAAVLSQHTEQTLLAYGAALDRLALDHLDQELNNSSLSVALEQRIDMSASEGRSWQRRLLIAGANAHYTRRVTLQNIANSFENYGFPKPTQALKATEEALNSLEKSIAEAYLEHKGDPLVGTIEPSMYMGRHKLDPNELVDDARPYVYEIINNLIAVHAEVDSICGPTSSRYMHDICETVCEELARLAACAGATSRAAAFQAHLEYTLLRLACAEHLERKADCYLSEVLDGIPPLDDEDKKRMNSIIDGFKKRMELQLLSLNCNVETV